MKRFLHFILLFGVVAVFLCSCNDEESDYEPAPPVVTPPTVSIGSGNFSMELMDSLILKADVTSTLATSYCWTMDDNQVSADSIYVFKAQRSGIYEISFTATNTDGSVHKTISITVQPGKYKYGTFILNEGLISTHGSLVYISPRGEITDDAYYRENGKYLGDLTQDLFIYNNKMYIVAQIGDRKVHTRGSLTVVNAETMKVEKVYQAEFSNAKFLNQPTHIAVLGENDIYMRDAKGIRLFHPFDTTFVTIAGSEKAHKNTMVVAAGKLFAAIKGGKTMAVIEKGKVAVSTAISFDGNVSGIVKSSDGKLWVSDESGKISKVDPVTYQILAQNQLEGDAAARLKINPVSSQAAAPHITAKGDTLYISATKTQIYRHIFSANTTKLMVDAKDAIPAPSDYFVGSPFTVYNTCAVNPVSGEVILNTLEGWGAARFKNHITVFDFCSDTYPRVARDYFGYTDYPANVFFTYNFE